MRTPRIRFCAASASADKCSHSAFYTLRYSLRLKTLILCAFLLTHLCTNIFSPAKLTAQNLIFEHLSYERGLSESNITAVLQDKQGFLWIGTTNGLNRFDGYKISTYRNDPKDAYSLGNNGITALYEDEAAQLWVGTQDGLFRLDRTTGRFTAYRNNPDSTNSLSNNLIRAVIEAPRGIFWIATKRGLNRFDLERNEWKLYKADKKGRGKGPSDNDISAMLQDPHNRAQIWLAAKSGGLNKLYVSKGYFKSYKPLEIDNEGDEAFTGVSAMTFDASGHLVLATRDNTLWQFDTENSTFSPIEPILPAEQAFKLFLNSTNRTLPSVVIQSLAFDKHGTLWAGTRDGIFSYMPSVEHGTPQKQQTSTLQPFSQNNFTTKWKHHTNNPNDAQSLSDNNVTVVFQDRSGVMWFGTQSSGLNKFAPQTAIFRNIKYDPLTKALPSPVVNAIARKNGSETWFGTQNGAVIYSGGIPKRMQATGYVVTAILHDSQGNTWLGTESGLFRYDVSGRETHFTYTMDSDDGISDNLVTALAEDKQGNIWIGTQGGGITQFNRRKQSFTRFWSDADNNTSLSEDFVFSILVSRSGTVWIGTNNGLNRFNPESEDFVTFTRAKQRDFPDAAIVSLSEDAKGAIWLGTLGGGLFRLDTASSAIQHFSRKNNLPSETIYGILHDNNGKLWLSTGRGLATVRYQGDNITVRSYDASDGLQSNTFRKGAYFRASDGTMLFGLGAGFVEFHPDSLRSNPVPPPLALTKFRIIGNENIATLTAASQTTFEINYNENIEIEYAALDFTNADRNEYAYRLGGTEKDWLYVGQQRTINGTSFDPGTYTLFIKAANSDGIWSETPLVITILVQPPWWGTWWFRTLAITLGIICIVAAYRLRVRRMITVNNRLQTLVAERTREISEQTQLLEAQATEIQMANGALQEKNVELERVLSASEQARTELERAYKLLDIENSRKTQELNEARAFQLSMLPRTVPQIPGLDIAFGLRTATEVGGDFYDYLLTPDGGLTLAIGDATGHGVRAGMLVSLVKSSFHALVHDYSLSETAGLISQTIKQMRLQRMFMCLSLLHLRRAESSANSSQGSWNLELSGAGMPPMMLYRAQTGKVEHIRTKGIVLGAMENAQYSSQELRLEAGDSLVLMSDGIIELFNADGEELGSKRVEDCFFSSCSENAENTLFSADTMLGNLFSVTEEWLGGETPQDDIAIVVVRIEA